MLLPGNNSLSLCGTALMAIVQKHLNDASYTREDGPIAVTGVKHDDGSFVFEVTNAKKQEGGAA